MTQKYKKIKSIRMKYAKGFRIGIYTRGFLKLSPTVYSILYIWITNNPKVRKNQRN